MKKPKKRLLIKSIHLNKKKTLVGDPFDHLRFP